MQEDEWRFVIDIDPTQSFLNEVEAIPDVAKAIIEDKIILRIVPTDASPDYQRIQKEVREILFRFGKQR